MSAAELSRFDELVSGYLDDTLKEADAAELVASLRDQVLAARFLEMTRLSSEIAGLLAAPVPDAAMVELVRTDIERMLAGEPAAGGVRLRILDQAQPHTSVPPIVSAPRPVPRERKPVLRALAWAAVFFVFAGLSSVFFINRTRPADAPTVASVQGEVRVVGRAGERVLTPGQSWQRDDKLMSVGPNSTARVKFSDGSQLDFYGDTVAVNESQKDGRRIELEHGSVQAAIRQQPARRPFIFATPEAEAVVVGTTLRLVAGNHSARLEVTEGEVRFRRRHDGVEVSVRVGHYALIGPNVPFVATPFHSAAHHQE
jgi:ferric-dicitrate binding protein FerR (iron transport regulator)